MSLPLPPQLTRVTYSNISASLPSLTQNTVQGISFRCSAFLYEQWTWFRENTLKMLGAFLSKTWTAAGQFFGPQRIDNRMNPVHLAIAQQGYWIQFHILYIPDRLGFFSSGPARLQVFQGFLFALLAFGLGFSVISGAAIVLWLHIRGQSVSALAGAMAAILAAVVAAAWTVQCFDRRRSPDYDWGEDWKLRIE